MKKIVLYLLFFLITLVALSINNEVYTSYLEKYLTFDSTELTQPQSSELLLQTDVNFVNPIIQTLLLYDNNPNMIYSDDFEGQEQGFTFVNDSSNKWVIGTAVSNGEGTKSMYISKDEGISYEYDTGTTSVSHAYKDITIPENTNQMSISFDWKCSGETQYDRLRIWAVPTTFVPVAGTQITSVTNERVQIGQANYNGNIIFLRENIINDVSNYAGQSIRLVFEWRNDSSGGNQPPISIDNLEITIVTCIAPLNLITNETTINTANISWTAPEDTNINSYEIYMGTENTNPNINSIPTHTSTETNFSFDNLATNTSYYAWVRASCGNSDKSFWIGPTSVQTAQIPSQLPFQDNFEDEQNLTFINDYANKWVIGTAVNNREGTKSMYISKDNGLSYEYNNSSASVSHAYKDIAIPTGTENIIISFDWKCIGEASYDRLRLWATTTSFNPTAGDQIIINSNERAQIGLDNYSGNSNFIRENITLNVANYAGQNMRLIFEWRNDSGGGNQPPIAIDNLEIAVITCTAPSNLITTEVTVNSAIIEWTAPDGTDVNSYDIYMATENQYPNNNTTPTHTSTVANFNFDNLTDNTNYYVWVRSSCNDNNKSFWTGPLSITTPQIPAQLPFQDNFEGEHNLTFTNDSTNKWVIGTAVSNGEGTKSMYISKDDGLSYEYTITTPSVSHAYKDIAIPENTNQISISFDWKCVGESSIDRLRVWVVPTSFNPIAGTQITTVVNESVQIGLNNYSLNNSFLRENIVLDVSNYVGQNLRVVFEWRNDYSGGAQPPIAIDNLEIAVINCAAPSNLISSEITNSSANISWTAPEGTTINSYDIYLGNNNQYPNNEPTHSSTDINFSFDSLSPNTTYYAWVRSNCDDNNKSFWTGPLSITTPQIPAQLPFQDNFEGEHNLTFTNDSTNKWVIGTAVSNGEGTKSMYISKDDGLSYEYTITTPSVSHAYKDIAIPENTNQISISFDWKCVGESSIDRLRVWVVPTSFNPVAGTQITTAVNNEREQIGLNNYSLNNSFLRENIALDVSNYVGQNLRVVFEWRNDYSGGAQPPIAIDNLKVDIITCVAPSNLIINQVNTVSADISWTTSADTSVNSYDIFNNTENQTPNENSIPTHSSTETSFSLNDLTPSTTYYVWVRSNCGDSDKSFWIGPLTIITTQNPAELPYQEDFEGDNDFIFIGDTTNKWVIGTAVHNGEGTKSLYISKDNGLSYEYNTSTSSVSHVYRDIAIPENSTQINILFDWKCVGESLFDRLKVWLVPTSFNPVAGTQITTQANERIQIGLNYYSSNNVFLQENIVADVANFSGQSLRLIFEWRNDSSGGSQPPIAIDNLKIDAITCIAPSDLIVNEISENTANISWTASVDTSVNSYDIFMSTENQAPNDNTTPTYTTTETNYIINDLTPNTNYYIWVRTNCGDNDKSFWIGSLIIITSQIPAQLIYDEDFEGDNNFTFINSATSINNWVIGNAVNNGGRHSLYVSKNEGVTHEFDSSINTTSHAYRDFFVEDLNGEMSIQFDWICKGLEIYSYKFNCFNVWLLPSNHTIVPGSRININNRAGYKLVDEFIGNTEFKRETFVINLDEIDESFNNGYFRIVFEWLNLGIDEDNLYIYNIPNAASLQPPAAIDNLLIKKITCPTVVNLSSEIIEGTENASLTWTPIGEETQWEIFIVPLENPNPTPESVGIIVDVPQYIFENGVVEQFYKFFVRPICSEDDIGFWSKQGIISFIKPPGCAQIDVDFKSIEINLSPNEKGDYVICRKEPTNIILDATYYNIPKTTSYSVEQIDYRPPFPFLGGIEMPITSDDDYTASFNLPFDFCFFGNIYNYCKIGDNGVITFGLPYTDEYGQFCPYYLPNDNIPNANYPIMNSIYGVYQDMLTTNNPGPDSQINYQIIGKYPCRTLVVNYNEVPAFGSRDEIYRTTTQIVLYEITNIIEVYVKKRTACLLWNQGYGLIGIQNGNGDQGYSPPGRNTGAWNATQEAWRFSPNGDSSVYFAWEKDGEFYSNDMKIEVEINESVLYTAKAVYESCEGNEVVVIKEYNFLKDDFDISKPNNIVDCTRKPEDINLFKLRDNDSVILGDLDPDKYTIEYFKNETDLENNTDQLPDIYESFETGSVFVKLTNNITKCYKSAIFNLVILPPIEVTKLNDLDICGEYELPILKEREAYYTEEFGKGDKYEGGDIFDKIGTHTIYIFAETEEGCFGQSEFNLQVVEKPVADIIEDQYLTCETFFLPTPSKNNKYYTEPNGSGEELEANKEIIYPMTIYIYAKIEGKNNFFCIDESSFRVEYEDCDFPKGISPNGDGINDFLDLTGYGIAEIKIYNRYGSEVYSHGVGYTNEWYGQDHYGNKLPDGTYYYMIISTGKARTGWIQINR